MLKCFERLPKNEDSILAHSFDNLLSSKTFTIFSQLEGFAAMSRTPRSEFPFVNPLHWSSELYFCAVRNPPLATRSQSDLSHSVEKRNQVPGF